MVSALSRWITAQSQQWTPSVVLPAAGVLTLNPTNSQLDCLVVVTMFFFFFLLYLFNSNTVKSTFLDKTWIHPWCIFAIVDCAATPHSVNSLLLYSISYLLQPGVGNTSSCLSSWMWHLCCYVLQCNVSNRQPQRPLHLRIIETC